MLKQAVVISVRVKGLKNIVGNAPNNGVDLEPIIQGLILLFVEVPDLFVLN